MFDYIQFSYDDPEYGVVSEPETFGCVMPGRCCMPGMHYPSECHTAEMIEAIEAEVLAAGGNER
jgi:hypothetical protein